MKRPTNFGKDVVAERVFSVSAGFELSFGSDIANKKFQSKKTTISVISSLPIKRGELERYSTAPIDSIDKLGESKTYDDLSKYRPVEWNEPDGLQKPSSKSLSKNYKDVSEYRSSPLSEHTTRNAKAEAAESYKDLEKYKAVTWTEPDEILAQQPQQELSKEHKELDKYGPVTWQEPNGLPSKAADGQFNENIDAQKYGPVQWNEPDGLPRTTPEEQSRNYDDLADYKVGFTAKDAVLKAHEQAQLDTTVKGEPLPDKVEVAAEDKSKEYKDLSKYGPVKWNEPDGLQPRTEEEQTKDYADLSKYSQYDNTGPEAERVHPEEASKQYKDLHKYDQFPNAGPTVERVHPEEVSKHYKDLHQYPTAGFEEPAKTQPFLAEEATKNYDDLHLYRSSGFDSPDKPYQADEPSKDSRDLGGYSAEMVRRNFVPAKLASAVAAGMKEFDGISRSRPDSKTELSHRAKFQSVILAEDPDSGFGSMDESFPREESRFRANIERISKREKLTAAQKLDAESDPYSKYPQGLETSFDKERGERQSWPMARHHQGRSDSDSDSSLFKMMAYDAATKSVTIVEVSTSAQDKTRATNPAEAILQLSQPSKFFPHFTSLQQQGYEIVSGSPDVLVFKKVREASDYSLPPSRRSRAKKLLLGTAGLAGGAYALSMVAEHIALGGGL